MTVAERRARADGPADPLLVDTAEARRVLGGISIETLKRLWASGEIEDRHVRGRRMWVYASLREYVERSDPG